MIENNAIATGNIRNFPAALQPIIQQGFLEREFLSALNSRLSYRMCADRRDVGAGIGETVTINGCAITLNHYAAITDLNMVTSRVGIASQFLLNAAINGEQASRSLDELARNALFQTYLKMPILRPNDRATMNDLQDGDLFTMGLLLNAVAQLRQAEVPEIDGVYNCYLDPISARQLFADHDFRQLFHGATSANQVFQRGMINDFLGLRFIPTTEAYVQSHPSLAGKVVRRPIIVGYGALIEGDFAAMHAAEIRPDDALVSVIDGVAMVTREPIDRLQQIIAQSWYWIGGFGCPANAEGKHTRAVVLEHVA